jgi:glutathione S-transferase
MTDNLVLFTNPMSRGRIARWMLEEAGVDYETRALGYGPDMKSADYLAINPMGKVPAVKHGHRVVTECAAICAYIADAFPQAGLSPALTDRADYYRWLFFAAGPLEAAVTNKSLEVAVPDEKQGFVGYGNFAAVMNTLATALSRGPFIAGDQFTAADVYVGAQVLWGLQFGTFEQRPEFAAYAKRLADRPAYKRANEKDDALLAEMKSAS